jgi:ATP-binding cassette subfamily C protein
VALLIAIGLLEGSGLLMLVPLLHALGLGAGDIRGLAGSAVAAVRGEGATASLPAVLAIIVAIKGAQAGLRAYSSTCNLKIETSFVCFLRDRFYRAMMQAGWLFVARLRSSDLSQALLAELPMTGSATRQLLALLSLALVALVQVVIAFSLSPAMTALALGSGAVVGLGLRRFRQRSLRLGQLSQGKRAEMAAAVSEHLAGMKIAKSHGRETQHFAHFQRAMNDIAAHTMSLHRVGALTGIWLEAGAVVALGIFVFIAVTVQHVDTAQLLVLVFVFTRLLSHFTTLQNLWHATMQTLPSFTSTEQLRARLNEAAEPAAPSATRAVVLREAIRVEGVTFKYDSAQPAAALRGVDLVFPARQVTALCGPSGAGKSTLADVLLGLLATTTGRVTLDGVPLDGALLHAWRQSIGYVPQETFLFHESVRTNLLWAQPEASEADLRAALRDAAAEAFVDRLPQGLDTVVGDRGVRLSGGERQRLALARALLRRPTLLVLDEATSSLDTHNERLVQDAIDRLHGELTIVLIAHRLSTVRFADRIVVLAGGAVAESGTWDELCAREQGVFRKLVAADAIS